MKTMTSTEFRNIIESIPDFVGAVIPKDEVLRIVWEATTDYLRSCERVELMLIIQEQITKVYEHRTANLPE